MESPARALDGESPSQEDLESNCDQPLFATSDLGGQPIVVDAASVAVSDAGLS